MKIFLIGMPGSGKTTVGKLLAQKMEMPFIDLDVEIEKREGLKIKEIFADKGESYFREVESKVLKEVATRNTNFVVATGGGAPCFHHGIDIINQNGTSVFLDVSIDDLITRVKKDLDRPLLVAAGQEELRAKLDAIRSKRLMCYQQAKVVVSDSTVDVVYQQLKLKMQSQK